MITGREIVEALDSLEPNGALAWARCKSFHGTDLKYPFTAYRFKRVDEDRERLLDEAIRSFRGNVDWVVYRAASRHRNFVIEPKRVYEQEHGLENPIAPGGNNVVDPEFARKAYDDVPALAQHITNFLSIRSPIAGS
ncbi:MAG TPA: hypothetical protein VKT78_07910 [Fimbriimonadaceae bacterium]|nr:hypothetical protein [Fimbriimonadaceae bacterium]